MTGIRFEQRVLPACHTQPARIHAPGRERGGGRVVVCAGDPCVLLSRRGYSLAGEEDGGDHDDDDLYDDDHGEDGDAAAYMVPLPLPLPLPLRCRRRLFATRGRVLCPRRRPEGTRQERETHTEKGRGRERVVDKRGPANVLVGCGWLLVCSGCTKVVPTPSAPSGPASASRLHVQCRQARFGQKHRRRSRRSTADEGGEEEGRPPSSPQKPTSPQPAHPHPQSARRAHQTAASFFRFPPKASNQPAAARLQGPQAAQGAPAPALDGACTGTCAHVPPPRAAPHLPPLTGGSSALSPSRPGAPPAAASSHETRHAPAAGPPVGESLCSAGVQGVSGSKCGRGRGRWFALRAVRACRGAQIPRPLSRCWGIPFSGGPKGCLDCDTIDRIAVVVVAMTRVYVPMYMHVMLSCATTGCACLSLSLSNGVAVKS